MNELILLPESLLLAFLLLVLTTGVFLTIKFLALVGPLTLLRALPRFSILALGSLSGNLDAGAHGDRLSPGRAFVLGYAFEALAGSVAGLLIALLVAGSGVLVWIVVFSLLAVPVAGAVATAVNRGAPAFVSGRALSVPLRIVRAVVCAAQGVFLPLYLWGLIAWELAALYGALAILALALLGTRGIAPTGGFARYAFVIAVLCVLIEAVRLTVGGGIALPGFESFAAAVPRSTADLFRMISGTAAFLILSGLGGLRGALYAAHPGCIGAPARAGLIFALGPLVALLMALLAFAVFHGASSSPVSQTALAHPLLFVALAAVSLCATLGALHAARAADVSATRAPTARTRAGSDGVARALLWGFAILLWTAALYYVDSAAHRALVLRLTIYGATLCGAVCAGGLVLLAYFRMDQVAREMRDLSRDVRMRPQVGRDLALLFFHLLPTNLVSRLFGHFAELRLPPPIMRAVLGWYARKFRVDLTEAELDLESYPSLNLFFTRALKPGLRPIDRRARAVVSPVDGVLSQFGAIVDGTLMQAKGIHYRLEDLLAGSEFVERFVGGHYAVIYLSPRDYHRIHSPVDGRVPGYDYVPGRLFPVNLLAVQGIYDLFPKNERLTTYIENPNGLTALVKVGATNVGKITVIYDAAARANRWLRRGRIQRYAASERPIETERGAELARFEMGSTVVLLFEKDCFRFASTITEDTPVRLGQFLGELLPRR